MKSSEILAARYRILSRPVVAEIATGGEPPKRSICLPLPCCRPQRPLALANHSQPLPDPAMLERTRGLPPAPHAERRPKISRWHGITLTDDYAWLRADNWREV